jgi:hypothetical protein
VPTGVAVVIAVIVGVVLVLGFVFDLWRDVREVFGELREWWSDERH